MDFINFIIAVWWVATLTSMILPSVNCQLDSSGVVPEDTIAACRHNIQHVLNDMFRLHSSSDALYSDHWIDIFKIEDLAVLVELSTWMQGTASPMDQASSRMDFRLLQNSPEGICVVRSAHSHALSSNAYLWKLEAFFSETSILPWEASTRDPYKRTLASTSWTYQFIDSIYWWYMPGTSTGSFGEHFFKKKAGKNG